MWRSKKGVCYFKESHSSDPPSATNFRALLRQNSLLSECRVHNSCQDATRTDVLITRIDVLITRTDVFITRTDVLITRTEIFIRRTDVFIRRTDVLITRTEIFIRRTDRDEDKSG